ncbi:hypothetical protein DB35_00635 [Streptomyces abyssalis]|uniref:Uncharacterized protein n=1 Tax=Streptomyces abyssalis TaxID=933944 RepID=A0A1E7JVJ7_9ACTN|nr:hypothetical protein [Streptomyces abyssalis]OEU94477.1 hypothetical protein AN215_00585 [Streptomyces abyssalis]OEU95860.1 hypothetical protein DB35_00635 [Streptomyces abyssalis]OEV26737.1 hypothetical protein AN219_24320 [Streptomyces nanshensis]
MSDLAQHLATIELLRARHFPARHGREAGVVSGPGYHVAELSTSEGFWEDDGTARSATEDQYGAECGALSMLLTRRWGEPQVVSLYGVLTRSTEGEEMTEPWQGLSGGVPYVELWQADGRWIAVGVSQQGPELPFQLIAAVTVNDPP